MWYEIGIQDNGDNDGIDKAQIYETMINLFHMARELGDRRENLRID